jgi:signal transduction histidine kinase
MKLPRRTILGLGFGLVAAVLAANALVSVHELRRLQDNNHRVLVSARYLWLLEATFSSIKDAESGLRGYLLTGDADNLKPYFAALEPLRRDLTMLREFPDSVDQRAEAEGVERVVDEKLSELEETVSLGRSRGLKAARGAMMNGRRVRLMDEIRDRFRSMADRERGRLAERVDASRSGVHRASITIAVASLSALGLTALLGLGVFRHLSFTRRSARIVREQLERWRVTLASVGEGVIVTDGQENVVFLNPVAESLCAIPRALAVGRPLAAVFEVATDAGVPPTYPQATRPAPGSTARPAVQLGPTPDQVFLVDGDGVRRPIERSVAPIRGEGGEAIGSVIVFRDDSERRDRESHLVEENRRKDELVAMLAHELRNPLATILSASEVLYVSKTSDDLDWASEVIGREVRHLSRSLDDLIDVSRVTRELIELKKEWDDAGRIIRQAITVVRPLLEGRGLRLTTEFSSESLGLEADPARLEQILVNLLSNAARYTPEGGEIRVTADRVDSQVVIRVIDSGIGIASDVLPYIFELFAQGQRTLARSEGGLGIGLTIVKKIVELHGGSVSARSEGPGKGSTFTVRLPATKEDPVGSMASQSWPEQGSMAAKSRILIVDDNKDLATSLARLLKILGHDVEVVYDGRKGIETARTYRPNVVLLDIGLPNLDGYQVARTLREEGFLDTMIIAVSGYGQEEDRRRSRDAGMNHHLTKPVDVKTIAALISQPN